ncbi:hypothetical protein UK99_01355 [Frankia casuarinae]|uniref:hypothetical protein n=1 Tax=Frankia casuarinae (strain DSM 45818 / CECT 9043 / HFP020203 / CcI3) TaxID=106370 RepID=UPI000A2482AC|nr:hypothetical protein [Frankia casuarinae]ORT98511.1 hypothetical protein UK99_01355 [Frankia casuarinae]
MGKISQRVEQEELRARMRAVGMAHDEIAIEFARRYRLRPRAAHRVAHGWTQQQAAGHINAYDARVGLDPESAALMSSPWLSELENWPLPARRRLTPQILAVLAAVYGTDIHNLLDLDDREHLAAEDVLLVNRMRRPAPPQLFAPAGMGTILAVPDLLPNGIEGLPGSPVPVVMDQRRQDRTRAVAGGGVARPTAAGGGNGSRLDETPAGWLVERMVTMAARESADFSRVADRSNVGPLTVEQFHDDVTWLATRYPHRPVAPSFAEIVELRNQAFNLLEDRQRPEQARDLYAIAGVLCGMLANASFDLGYLPAATTQARTAFLCGELAGHNGLRCWVRGMQSLIAYWQGRLPEAVNLAREGWEFVPEHGTARVRAAALEARAAGRLGDEATVRDALERARQARDEITDEDTPGGMLAFPESKQSFYTASAYLGLHGRIETLPADSWAARAEQAARTAIGLYETAPAGEQRLGELSLARLDLAAAHLERSELDGAAQTIRTVLDTMTRRPTDSVLRRLRQLVTVTDRPHYRQLLPAQHLREEILDVCATAGATTSRSHDPLAE